MILLPLVLQALSTAIPATVPDDQVEFVTRIRMTIGVDGKAKDCALVEASGMPELDAKICPMMMAKARFAPKPGADGKPAEFTYATSVRWRLPKSDVKPDAPPAQ